MKKLFLSIVSVMTAVAVMVLPASAAFELDDLQAKEGNRNLRATEQNEVLSMSREIENPIRFEIPCTELNLMQYTNDDTPKQGKEICFGYDAAFGLGGRFDRQPADPDSRRADQWTRSGGYSRDTHPDSFPAAEI